MNELQEYERIPLVEVRYRVIERLKLNFAHDNLEEKEFETRLEQANAATSKKQLIEIVADLPVFKDDGKIAATGNVKINTGRVQETGTLFAVLGGSGRKGVWRPARSTNAVAFMGGVEIDYSEAEMPPGVTELNVFCVMGGIDIVVPEGMGVEVHALPIMGGVDNRSDGIVSDSAPILKVRGFVLMGGIDIKVKGKK